GFRLHFFIEPVVPRVASDADDLAPVRRLAEAQPLAYGVFVGKVAARQSLVNDDYAGRVSPILLGKSATPEEGDAHRAEIPGADGTEFDHRALAGRVWRTAFDVEAGRTPTEERNVCGHAGGDHARQTTDSLHRLLEEIHLPPRLG